MLRARIARLLEAALADAGIAENLGFKLDVPPNREMGDYALNIAIALARQLSRNPLELAQQIAAKLENHDRGELFCKIEIAKPGFINLFLNDSFLQKSVLEIIKQDVNWGNSKTGQGKRVLLEFVSANPTGPLHVGHGRWAVIGDAIGRLLTAAGYFVEREFYINNIGNQIAMLRESVKAVTEGRPVPEGGYGGTYIKDLVGQPGDVLDILISQQKKTLSSLDVNFDQWYFESNLHEKQLVKQAIAKLHDLGKTFEEGGAIWFKSQELGDDKNRVLIREDGQPTYFAADIAYHLDKYNRGYDHLINIWGTDHHGYVNRLKAAIGALGLPTEKLEIIIGQLVTLKRGQEPIRMSKRTGEMITLAEVIEEIGKDAVRFFFSATDVNSHLDFDLELAKKQSTDNPVYYLQYAHARICSILNKSLVTSHQSPVDLSVLTHPAERELMLKLIAFPDTVLAAAEYRHPHRITEYGKELATVFHYFYEKCRVLENPARLVLVDATRITLRNVLKLLGISAPEKM